MAGPADRHTGEGPHRGRGPKDWSRGDGAIHDDVCDALSEDRLLDARGIGVQVRAGVVVLQGHVPGGADVTLAEMIARRTSGVRDVTNELSVAALATPEDRPPLGATTGADSELDEGERDAEGRREGPKHFPKLST